MYADINAVVTTKNQCHVYMKGWKAFFLIFLVGTYKLKEPEAIHSVIDAGLECGYRMIGKLSQSIV